MTTLDVRAGDLHRSAESTTAASRWLTLTYGAVCYAFFLGVFLYALGFVANLLVPRSIDGPAAVFPSAALAINLGLIALFGLQHSVMARPTFKKLWTRAVPEQIERSTYVLFTNICFVAMFALWQPMPGIVWDVQNPIGRGVMWALFAAGWLMVLITTFLINHFDLFGLRQVWMYFRGQPYTHLGFRTPGIYKHIRHPLYVGWIMAFWAIPTLTIGHMVFAAGLTAYILIAIQFEERNLMQFHAEYAAYRRRTGWFLPRLKS
jgi:protein-S-isoprenylcysteine O-methyltransferase Ste14